MVSWTVKEGLLLRNRDTSCILEIFWEPPEARRKLVHNQHITHVRVKADLMHALIFKCTVTGSITHHEEVARLRKVYELVQDARQQIVGEPLFCQQPAFLACFSNALPALRLERISNAGAAHKFKK